ncbi:piggyBac transposable element-derived 4-like protein [Labeo rohita]|uniref:PiggyBac transposable element-derived 4-like protein n=1 Tax=Labeo rohita TaxID=84645 RepID=A0A498NBZ5_LABRO|nr:piggyBac transposable element-derived 4-like protein [Labeo rohita]
MCSSLHSANGGQTVQRRVKTGDGQWTTMTIPIPTVVSDYNKSMGGVDTSDALIGLYSAARKTRKWYSTIFFHFVDIAVVNAYIIHQQLAATQNKRAKNSGKL